MSFVTCWETTLKMGLTAAAGPVRLTQVLCQKASKRFGDFLDC
jgi:hypothetical protein